MPRPPPNLKSPCRTSLQLTALPGIPIITKGDDIARVITTALERANIHLEAGDVLAITSKIISRAEGRFVDLDAITPGARACEIAAKVDRDPRLVELVLRESDRISRMGPRILVVCHRLGLVLANAGIDRSNLGAPTGFKEPVLLLPEDPDRSARTLRDQFRETMGVEIAIVVTDSLGRPFRIGTQGVAVGLAGMPAVFDQRGQHDLFGRTLETTITGFADQVAAAADLVSGQGAEGRPVVHIRGLAFPSVDGCARDLVRAAANDLYA